MILLSPQVTIDLRGGPAVYFTRVARRRRRRLAGRRHLRALVEGTAGTSGSSPGGHAVSDAVEEALASEKTPPFIRARRGQEEGRSEVDRGGGGGDGNKVGGGGNAGMENRIDRRAG